MSCTPEPVIQPCDTGQWIPLKAVNWLWHGMDVQYIVASGLQASMCDISNPLTWKGWTYLLTYVRMILSEPKFLGCIDNQILFTHGAVLRTHLRLRAPPWQYFSILSSFSFPYKKH